MNLLNFHFNTNITAIFMLLILISTIQIIFIKKFIEIIVLNSAISLFISICYLFMDAPDVAITEASVNACITTCILLNFKKYNYNFINKNYNNKIYLMTKIISCFSLFITLCWIGNSLPQYGTSIAEKINHYYTNNTIKDFGQISIITSILTGYRSYDTFMETLLIFTSGLCVQLIKFKKYK